METKREVNEVERAQRELCLTASLFGRVSQLLTVWRDAAVLVNDDDGLEELRIAELLTKETSAHSDIVRIVRRLMLQTARHHITDELKTVSNPLPRKIRMMLHNQVLELVRDIDAKSDTLDAIAKKTQNLGACASLRGAAAELQALWCKLSLLLSYSSGAIEAQTRYVQVCRDALAAVDTAIAQAGAATAVDELADIIKAGLADDQQDANAQQIAAALKPIQDICTNGVSRCMQFVSTL